MNDYKLGFGEVIEYKTVQRCLQEYGDTHGCAYTGDEKILTNVH